MDAKERKALFRAKLAAQKQEKRIDSPLVRYNEVDQPFCRVCNVPLKSESLWPAHQASRKHHEAIKNIKDSAAGITRTDYVKSDSRSRIEPVAKSRSSSSLPSDFFDNNVTKKPNTGLVSDGRIDSVTPQKSLKPEDFGSSASTLSKNEGAHVINHSLEQSDTTNKPSDVVNVQAVETEEESDINASTLSQTSRKMNGSEVKQVKGALPEGFFDNKDADLRARGIEPVKLDIKDEYKEFEKLIQEDLQEVDDRLEEEEFDAAEVREEAEALEQKSYMERVEMLKSKQMELRAAKFATVKKKPRFMGDDETSEESSSDGDEEEENLVVDWRAKHL